MNNSLILNQPFILPLKRKVLIKNILILNLILFFLLFLLSIFQIGSLIKDISLISEYEKKIKIISKENETLEIELSRLDSLTNIENYLEHENFTKIAPNQIKYFQILEGTVVIK